MSYISEVLADAPWAFWELTETSIATSAANSGSSGTAFAFGSGVTAARPALLSDGGRAAAGSGAAVVASLGSVPTGLSGANVTLEAWVNIPAGNINGAFVMIGGNGSNGWGMGIGGTDWDTPGRALVLVNEGIAWHASSFAFTTGIHHVVAVRGAAGAITCYVDGVSVFTTTMSSPNAATTGVSVGGEIGVAGRFLPPSVDVDNVAIFASALTSTRVAAHYASGVGDNTALAADSPTVWLKFDELATGLADASGNARTSTIVGTATLNQSGPFAGAAGVAFPGAAAGYAIDSTVSTTAATLECWFYVSTLDTTNGHWLMGCAAGYNSTTTDKNLYIRTDGKIGFHVSSSGNQFALSAGAITTGAWHHVVASVGAAGMKVRLDKVSGTVVGIGSSYAGSMNVILRGGGSTASAPVPPNGSSGAITLAMPAFYTKQLTDARSDAHFDASIPPAPTGTISATLPHLTASVAAAYGPSGSLTATLPSLTGSLAGNSQAPGASGDLVGTLPALAASLGGTYTLTGSLSASLPALASDMLGSVESSGVLAASLPSLAVSLAGTNGDDFLVAVLPSLSASIAGHVTPLVSVGTNRANRGNGIRLSGSAVAEVDAPLADDPPNLTTTPTHIITPTVPAPTLVNGRPQ